MKYGNCKFKIDFAFCSKKKREQKHSSLKNIPTAQLFTLSYPSFLCLFLSHIPSTQNTNIQLSQLPNAKDLCRSALCSTHDATCSGIRSPDHVTCTCLRKALKHLGVLFQMKSRLQMCLKREWCKKERASLNRQSFILHVPCVASNRVEALFQFNWRIISQTIKEVPCFRNPSQMSQKSECGHTVN